MKTRKSMTWMVAAMVVALSLASAPVWAGTISAISAPLATKPIWWPSYLVLYNDTGEDVYDVQVMKLMYMDVNGFYHWEKIKDVAYIALHTQVVVSVPNNCGLAVWYCVGRDGCNPYTDLDAKSTGDFGPVKSGYFYITLH